MELVTTPIKGLYFSKTELHEDDRGTFSRVFCNKDLKIENNSFDVVQMNISKTYNVGTIRGMHFQAPPFSEVKMVRCIRGEVFDVAVDLRGGSETFLHWHGEYLSPQNRKMMIIPQGFAHGFQVIKKNSELLYLHSATYNPDSEGSVHYKDPKINIGWPIQENNVSERDLNTALLEENYQGIKI